MAIGDRLGISMQNDLAASLPRDFNCIEDASGTSKNDYSVGDRFLIREYDANRGYYYAMAKATLPIAAGASSFYLGSNYEIAPIGADVATLISSTCETEYGAGSILRAYNPNDYATHLGKLYRFIVQNSGNSWSSSDVQLTSVCDDLTRILNDLAPAFDATQEYSAGTYVTYNGGLYRLTAAHATNETWANTSKVAVSVGDDIVNYLPTLFAPAGYGLGDILPVRLRTGQSLNTDTDTKCGFYYWLSTNPPTGAPYTQAAGILTPRFQIVFGAAGDDRGKLAFRTKSTNWTAWYELTGTALS